MSLTPYKVFCAVFLNYNFTVPFSLLTEAAVRRCFSKQKFLKISYYSQENTCVGALIGIFKNSFFH